MTKITISTNIPASLETVWNAWTLSEHIVNWNFASDDWHCPKASNDLKVGGIFSSTMAARDGSVSFDFTGKYNEVKEKEKISYTMFDGRECDVLFTQEKDSIKITEIFDPENIHPSEFQKAGWQAILENFKKYVLSL